MKTAMYSKVLTFRILGFLASLFLTLAAYLIVAYPQIVPLKTPTALISIFALAVMQSIVQIIFFIDLWREKSPRLNLVFFISTVLIIFIIIIFSIWIMYHLNYNMMPWMFEK